MLVPILAALPGDRLLFVSIRAKAPLSSCLCARSERMTVVSGDTMANYSYILFNKTPAQLRQLGSRGGKAYARNQRARRALAPPKPESVALPAVPQETTPAAIAILDAQFPWLRGAEKQRSRSQSPGPTLTLYRSSATTTAAEIHNRKYFRRQ